MISSKRHLIVIWCHAPKVSKDNVTNEGNKHNKSKRTINTAYMSNNAEQQLITTARRPDRNTDCSSENRKFSLHSSDGKYIRTS